MRFTGETTDNGVVAQDFELEVGGARVPGVLWTPAGATGPRPLVLMGHGGSQHKRTDTLVAKAEQYARKLGFAVAAIDAPEHGDRVTPEQAAERAAVVRQRIAEGRKITPDLVAAMAQRAMLAVPEWRATLDGLGELDVVGRDQPIGYWGVSMGTIIGVPLVAAEPRITAAVFGLAGLAPGNFAQAAAAITVPIEFVFQWDDELADREAGLALFDAFGSAEKTMHVNPGGHLGIPQFERDGWERFFARHLSADRASAPVH